jgi:FkbM family methyltransferase
MNRIYTANHSFYFYQNDYIGNELVKRGEWEPELSALIRSLVKPEWTCIDIGANVGYHTVHLSKLSQSVYAFEPQVETFFLLYQNILQNQCTNVHVYNVACGNVHEIVRMPLIQPLQTNRTLNMGNIHVNEEHELYHTIKSIRIDDLGIEKPVHFIKMDIQGCELKCLEGMKQILDTSHPYLVIELEDIHLSMFNTSARDIIEYLIPMGYMPFLIESSYPSDYLFVHSSNLESFLKDYDHLIQANDIDVKHISFNMDGLVSHKITLI